MDGAIGSGGSCEPAAVCRMACKAAARYPTVEARDGLAGAMADVRACQSIICSITS